jgi:hypothetical protein
MGNIYCVCKNELILVIKDNIWSQINEIIGNIKAIHSKRERK